ncbi:putative Anamorsin [Podospora fimiseda]|uniref:Anamorsin n=1 Tax=Podospora fimiseda TaxID=252190 RepID=A0AAN7GV17_9PEZI|nr:putative Anamorsin [Podospora fimiseda]
MPPSVMIDTTPDLDFGVNTPTQSTGGRRTLLLAPPSLTSRADSESRLSSLFTVHQRASTDLHMLDRLAANLVSLPAATYDLILVLTDPDGSRRAEAAPLLSSRDVWAKLVTALKAGGQLRSEDGSLSQGNSTEGKEAVFAGLVAGNGGDGFVKPDYAEEEVVPLRFGLKKKTVNADGSVPLNLNKKPAAPPTPSGVGFVDFSNDLDLDAEDDDDVVDENTLLTEEDMYRAIQQPPECAPQPGKKRRACKDCTCGLAERLEAEDKARREKADQGLKTLKLQSEDLTELDFTVQGKTGSCNSCYLGDAFRCADCPYTGLPAFKPGEEVKILNNVAQI